MTQAFAIHPECSMTGEIRAADAPHGPSHARLPRRLDRRPIDPAAL